MTLLEKLQELLNNEASAEDIQSALGEFMVPKGTFNKVNEENKELKQEINKFKLDLEKANDELEEIKTANMNEQELLQHRLEKYEEQLKQHTIEKNRLAAEKTFVGAGFTEEEYLPLLEQIVTEDAEKTISLVDGFVKLAQTKVKEKTQEELDKLLEKGSELPQGNDDLPHTITLEEFKNMGAKERTELFNNDRDLYNELSNAEFQK